MCNGQWAGGGSGDGNGNLGGVAPRAKKRVVGKSQTCWTLWSMWKGEGL